MKAVFEYGATLDDVLTKYQESAEATLSIVPTGRGCTRKLPISMKIRFVRPIPSESPNNNVMGLDVGFVTLDH